MLNEAGRRFVIPEYQRPYRWGKDECETLWNDILSVFGDGNDIEEYFLGSIVAYENEKNQLEIIDGQQRITTLTLLFRAVYKLLKTEYKFGEDYVKDFGKCIWDYERDEGLRFDKYHLISQVATDNNAEVLKKLLSKEFTLEEKDKRSYYSKNYEYFCETLKEFKQRNISVKKFYDILLLGKKTFCFACCL